MKKQQQKIGTLKAFSKDIRQIALWKAQWNALHGDKRYAGTPEVIAKMVKIVLKMKT